VTSFTDSRFVRPAGVAAYGFSPFPFFITDTMRIGDSNEHVSLDGFVSGVELYRRVVERLVF
jgi:acetylornithine deacetylase/succinyl-diaminopimelate desuccinylase-like protein